MTHKILLQYGPTGPVGNTSALVHVMACRLNGDKQFSEQMLT